MAAKTSHTLSGYVADVSGVPIAYATVSVKNFNRATLTDDAGHYIFTLPAGKYTVEVAQPGYDPVKKDIDLAVDTIVNFTLTANAVTLSEVQVTGKTAARRLKDGALAVNAVEIKTNANRLTNLNNIVDRSAGVKVRREGGLGADLDMSINGLSGNSIRYFIDGVPLDTRGSQINLDNIPVNTVDRVELYKGVVPSSLGADALGGAVNIITKRERRNYIDASYGAGSFHTQTADLSGQIFIPGTALAIRPQFGLTYSKNDYKMKDVEIWSEEQDRYILTDLKRFHDDYLSIYTQLEAGVSHVSWADAFYVTGGYTKIDKELQTGAMQNKVYGMAERNSNAWNVNARYLKTSGPLTLRINLSHTGDRSVTVDTAYRKYSWDGTWLPSSGSEIGNRARSIRRYSRPLTVVNAGASYDFHPGHNIALDYMMNRRGNKRTDDIDRTFEPSNDVVTKHIIALTYSQSLLADRWQNTFFVKDYINHTAIEQTDNSTITGANLIKPDATKSYWGAGFGSRYTLFEPLSVKGSYEHSVRLPLSRELLGNGTTVYPNLALNPEQSNNYNIGLFGSCNIDNDNRISYEVNGFMRHVQNHIRAVVSEREGMMQYLNTPAVEVKGIDIDLRYTWRDALTVSANGSWNDARDLKRFKSDGNPSATYKNRVPNRPWLFANVEAEYTLHGFMRRDACLRITVPFQWVNWYYLNWEAYGSAQSKAKIPTQKTIDIALTYSWLNNRYAISAECDNIFDALCYDNYMLQKPGRAFYAKFRIFIN